MEFRKKGNVIELKRPRGKTYIPAARFVIQPTRNCQLCSLGGVCNLTRRKGALEYAISIAPQPLILLDVSRSQLKNVLRILKEEGRTPKKVVPYTNTNGHPMTLLLVKRNR